MKRILLALASFLLISLYVQGQSNTESVNVKFQNGADGALEAWGENSSIIPMQLKVEFSKLENLQADADLPFQKILPGKMPRSLLFTLRKTDPQKAWGYKVSYVYYPGDTSAVPDLNHLYLIPFAHGTKHKVGQGYFGTFSHTESPYALDFDMDVGTEVTAARGGLVFEVKQDSNEGGVGSYYQDKGNYVKVLHDDGTMATYVHLKLKGAAVKVGDQVTEGQLLGYSGNTGYSSGPHLHFEVSRPQAFESPQSIPTVFKPQTGEPRKLSVGDWVYAVHPGKDAFKETYGKDLTDESYALWDKNAAPGDKINIRKEITDDTVAFFVANPTKSDMEIKMTLAGDIVPSKKQPVTLKVKAGKEAYIGLIKPNKTGAWKYNYNWSYRPLN